MLEELITKLTNLIFGGTMRLQMKQLLATFMFYEI